MSQSTAKITVVTGASSGIGMEAAKLFAQRGDDLVLVARRKDRLEQLAAELEQLGRQVLVIQADLSDTASAGPVLQQSLDRFGRIDILVNNAGFSAQTLYETMEQPHVEKMFRVNVLTPMELTRQAIPILQKQGGGVIVNVASVAGFVTSPMNTVYCATKHAVVGFSRSLRQELSGTGVKVTVVCPGNTKTEFFEQAAKDGFDYPDFLLRSAATAEDVAREVVNASDGRRELVLPGAQAKLMYYTMKLFPFAFSIGGSKYRGMIETK